MSYSKPPFHFKIFHGLSYKERAINLSANQKHFENRQDGRFPGKIKRNSKILGLFCSKFKTNLAKYKD
jgi:hypothetical protein